jgi:YVTN family beta-propeller protein
VRHVVALLTVFVFSLTCAHFASTADAPPARPVYKNPLDVTVDEKGETARVVLTGPRTVAVVDLKAGRVVKEEPWPKGKRMPEADDIRYRKGRGIDRTASIGHLQGEGNSVYALRASAQGKRLLGATLRIAKPDIPATQLSQAWLFSNLLAVRTLGDPSQRSFVASFDSLHGSFADLNDLELTQDESRAFVASSGADVILAVSIDEATFSRKVASASYDDTPGNRVLRAAIPTQSNPRRLGLSGDGKTLVVSNYLSDSLTVIDTEKLKVVKHISLDGWATKPDAARRGEILFNSAKLTQFGQFTCASCHPNGGTDGLNWDLPRDGIGNPKNTKSLLGVKDTAPYGWLGTSATLADRVRGTLRTLHRYEPEDHEVSYLVAYLETLEPPSPPPLTKGGLGGVAELNRGRALFDGKAGCVTCHSGTTFQDGKSHNVGTGTIEGEDRFDTPSLRGVRLTAPYLHDGRAATIDEIFTKHNAKKQHGSADGLTAEELADVIAYLKSL